MSKSGLRFSLDGEYRPMTISPLDVRKCWEPEFQRALRDIAGETYPQADFELGSPDRHVTFSQVNQCGRRFSRDRNHLMSENLQIRKSNVFRKKLSECTRWPMT